MLQATKPFITEIDAPQESSPRELVHWAIGIVRRQFALIVSIALIVASLGAVYALHGTADLYGRRHNTHRPEEGSTFSGRNVWRKSNRLAALESQVELVKSEPVALAVIKQLRLADDAEFLRSDAGLAGVLRSALRSLRRTSQTGLCPNSRLPGAP